MIHRPRFPKLVIALLSFALGVFSTAVLVWQLGPFVVADPPAHAVGVQRIVRPASSPPAPTLVEGTSGRAADVPEELVDRNLAVPVEGVQRTALVDSFDDERGARKHEAIDILAPRNTPVLAVEDGTIARFFTSAAGGLTIYQFDPAQRFVYYYAHLDRYAENLSEGDRVRKGQVIGYVGTTGNAPQGTPHLHFAIFRMTGEKKWWEGTPIDPYYILRKTR